MAANRFVKSTLFIFTFTAFLLTGCGSSNENNPLGQTQAESCTLSRAANGVTDPSRCVTDQFQQPTPPATKKVDLLFVMDNSESMNRHWQLMAQKIDRLIRELPAGQDIRFAVIMGTIQKNTGVLFSAPSVPKVLDGTKMSSAQISAALSKTFAEALKDKNVDWIGAGEALLYSTYYAATTHAKEIQAQGFFRADAALDVIFMSDDADESFPYPSKQFWDLPPKCNWSHHEKMRRSYHLPRGINVDSTFAALHSLKGDQPVIANAFVNITRADILVDNKLSDQCIFDSPGLGYFQIVQKTNGVLYSIHGDKGAGLSLCGKALNTRLALIHDFTLSKPSNLVDPASIEASVDGEKVAHTYDANSNVVHLENAGRAGSTVAIHHCEPAPQNDWAISDFTGSAAQTTAALNWKTGETESNSKVLYGTDPNALNDSVSDASMSRSHALQVSGLSPNTVYYFQAVSKDKDGLERTSEVISLRTKPDWAIAQVSAQASRNTASVSWNTAAYPTFGRIVWGTSANQLVNTSAETMQTNAHTVMVADLSPNTVYYFQAISRDEFGLEKRSAVVSARTVTDWSIVGFGGSASRTGATLSWQTPEYATSGVVKYGLSANALTNSVNAEGESTSHSVSVANLSPGTTYYFQAVAADDLGAEKKSAIISLTTMADWTLGELTVGVTEKSFTASFSTPGYPTTARILWGSSPSLGNEAGAGEGIDHIATVEGLNPDTDYYVQAVAKDNLGVERQGPVKLVHTNPIPLPQWSITDIAGTATVNSVSLSWNTSEYATIGTVRFGKSPDALSGSVAECGSGITHSVTAASLDPDTTYYFQIVARDDRGQEQTSTTIAIRTQALPLPNWEITDFAGTPSIHSVSLLWNTSAYATKGKVRWGLSRSALDQETAAETDAATVHGTQVTGLSANTTYYFQIVASDDRGQQKSSEIISARTTAGTPNWKITGFDASTNANSATVIWQTDVATKSTLSVGLSETDLTFKTIELNAFNESHLVTVTGLSPNTRYYFRVLATDGDGGSVTSTVLTKTTKPAGKSKLTEPSWKITGFDGSTNSNSATLIWQTDVPTKGVVRVGLTPTNLTYREVDVPDFDPVHLVTVSNLPPRTKFYFQVLATDQNGLQSMSTTLSKTTKP